MRMRTLVPLGLIVGLLAGASSTADAQQPTWQAEAKKFGWRLDYEKAKAEAKKTGKPLMVVFRCVP